MNTSNQTVKQLSNGDAVVWKLGTSYRDVGVTCGVCKSEVPLEDLKSGESDGSYRSIYIRYRPLTNKM